MKNKKTTRRRVNYVNVIIFALVSAFLMYSVIFLIYRDMNKKADEKAANAAERAVTVTEITETAEETTTTPLYNYDYTDIINPDRISAKSAIIYNKTTNTILFEKNPDFRCYPASTTKLITAMTALEKISPDTVFTVGTEIQLIGEGSSSAYLNEGSQLTLGDLIYGMLLPSGNDAAYTIAVNTARTVSGNPAMTDAEAVEYFCGLMNDLAAELEMDSSHFADPDGWYREDHYVTASDMLKAARAAIEYPQITAASSSLSYRVTSASDGIVYVWENNNKILFEDSEYYFPYADGLKTGFTDEAGYCYVATASKDNTEIIALIFGSSSLDDRYRDIKNLFNAVFEPSAISYAETTAPDQPVVVG